MRKILKQILERASGPGDWHPPIGVLQEAWSGLVGPRVAVVTRPAAVNWEEGRLTIEVVSENWRTELERHERKLLVRIRRVLPWELESLEIQVGMFDVDERSPDNQRRVAGTIHETHTGESPGNDGSTEAETPGSSEPTVRADDTLDGDVEESLDKLDSGLEETARRILDHVRDS